MPVLLRSFVITGVGLVAIAIAAASCGGGHHADTIPYGDGTSGGTSSSGSTGDASSSSGSTGGTSSGSTSGNSSGDPIPSGPLTPLQKKKAEMLTSIWENSTTVLQYGFSQNINDGRGYTSGRAGFCTGTGDAFLVVKCLDQKFGTSAANAMHKYLPVLEQLEQDAIQSGEPQGDTGGLDDLGDYNADWTKTATDVATKTIFANCQDELVHAHYFTPAVAAADKVGLTTALSIAILYDSTIVHGNEGNLEIVNHANDATGNPNNGAKLSQAAESQWLESFLGRRLDVLQDGGGQSVDRGALYEQLRRDGNWDLSKTIVTNAKAHLLFPNKGFEDSHYPSCTIDTNANVSGDPACTK